MQGTMNIEVIGHDFKHNPKRSPIPHGPLKLPEGMTVDGQLIAIGENDDYLHCIVSNTGHSIGVAKMADENHLYQHLLRLNAA